MRMPFKFSKLSNYAIETIDDTSDEYFATLLANAMQIEAGELPLSTFFGVKDPSFDERATKSIVADASAYIPEITITKVISETNNDGTVNVSVKFTRED